MPSTELGGPWEVSPSHYSKKLTNWKPACQSNSLSNTSTPGLQPLVPISSHPQPGSQEAGSCLVQGCSPDSRERPGSPAQERPWHLHPQVCFKPHGNRLLGPGTALLFRQWAQTADPGRAGWARAELPLPAFPLACLTIALLWVWTLNHSLFHQF